MKWGCLVQTQKRLKYNNNSCQAYEYLFIWNGSGAIDLSYTSICSKSTQQHPNRDMTEGKKSSEIVLTIHVSTRKLSLMLNRTVMFIKNENELVTGIVKFFKNVFEHLLTYLDF